MTLLLRRRTGYRTDRCSERAVKAVNKQRDKI
jgi:hypothetical protein